MTYTKFAWVGNQISDLVMTELYKRKQRLRIPITQQVAKAMLQS